MKMCEECDFPIVGKAVQYKGQVLCQQCWEVASVVDDLREEKEAKEYGKNYVNKSRISL